MKIAFVLEVVDKPAKLYWRRESLEKATIAAIKTKITEEDWNEENYWNQLMKKTQNWNSKYRLIIEPDWISWTQVEVSTLDTFKPGDRVRIASKSPGYLGLRGVIVSIAPNGLVYVLDDDGDTTPWFSTNLEFID